MIKNDITIGEIINVVCKIAEVDETKVMGKNRQRKLVTVKRIISALLRNHFSMTCYEIGVHLKKDHSTIVHYMKNHRHNMKHDIEYRYVYNTSLMAVKGNFIELKDELDETEINDSLLKRNEFLENKIKRLEENIREIQNIANSSSLYESLKH